MCYPSRENSVDQFLEKMIAFLNNHDRDLKTMSDPDWLEVIGHPTIPHVQSLRAPPAQVALHTNKESLIGLANRKASRRYLEKLQKDRERNQEVLHECVDNLPIVIRQMVYPDKPSPTQPWRVGTGSHTTSREKKFRVGKQQDDGFWQENIEQWVKSEQTNNQVGTENAHQTSLRGTGSNKTITTAHERKNTLSTHSESAENVGPTAKEYVHHAGFQGSAESVSSTLKYKFGKKKSAASKEPSSQPVTFKPKGFGSLYDELEFERRYKKVFDLNKHIHFVHSNFVTGQRIYKRNKLPPIGHIPSINSDPTDGQDIFAIMSVQKFNHPDGAGELQAPVTSPSQVTKRRQQMHRTADGFAARPRHKRHTENTQELDVPVGFIPDPVQTVGSSPFDGIKGNLMYKEGHSRLSMASCEGDSALGTLTEETYPYIGEDDVTCTQSEASVKTLTSKKTKFTDDVKLFKQNLKKKRMTPSDQGSPDFKSENTMEDTAPFNISVHVEIKPKDPHMNGGDDIENERARDRRLPIEELPESPRSNESYGDKIMSPSKIDSGLEETESDGERAIRPKNVTTTTNQFGLITQKVHYPETFMSTASTVSESRSTKLFSKKQDIDGNNSN